MGGIEGGLEPQGAGQIRQRAGVSGNGSTDTLCFILTLAPPALPLLELVPAKQLTQGHIDPLGPMQEQSDKGQHNPSGLLQPNAVANSPLSTRVAGR